MDGLLILITSLLGPVLAATLVVCAATGLEILVIAVEFMRQVTAAVEIIRADTNVFHR